MKKILVAATLFLGALTCRAQEKVMNIQKTDGTNTQTRVADLQEITFLTLDQGGQGLLVKTAGGGTTAVLFEANPVVTVADGKLVVKTSTSPSGTAEAVEFEIANIAEILFGDATDGIAINASEGFSWVLQDGGALLRGIPKGVKPRIYALDGRSLPTPPLRNGEMRLNRTTMGKGVFIVKAGTLSTKIRL